MIRDAAAWAIQRVYRSHRQRAILRVVFAHKARLRAALVLQRFARAVLPCLDALAGWHDRRALERATCTVCWRWRRRRPMAPLADGIASQSSFDSTTCHHV